jgi:ActR/RegA family two-component response regulator
MPAPEHSRAVLLVEDDAALQSALARFLELNGFTVIAVSTADEALAASARELAGAIVDCLGQGSGRDVVVSIPADRDHLLGRLRSASWSACGRTCLCRSRLPRAAHRH